ncbi:MAG: hypothetical protein K2P81_12220 [Bacteriovoracaceae bacterium]|nr:hypothetical protein [Bacteriovoracaceae bacterium]
MKKLALVLALISQSTWAAMPRWSYDAGPDPKTKMGKELIDLTAAIPNMPAMSEQIMGEQKFRPAFGPVPWRMLQKANSVKILFIGQDATHIAEAAGRPATAGFGGRAQDLAAYFGVNEGAAFINTYAFTIKGQYGAFDTPYVLKSAGEARISFARLLDNSFWLISHDQDSPAAKWRNNLIDWIIRNNRDSLKLIVTFGGAANDAIATFIESKGAEVGTRLSKQIKSIQVPEISIEYAGGNFEYPALLNDQGRDLYQEVMGRKVDYTNEADQAAAKKDLKDNEATYISKMVFSKGGPLKNGILHPAQLGGFELDEIKINNKITRSLKALPLNDGTRISQDVLVVELPHPTSLSMMTNSQASEAVGKKLKVLQPYVEAGWKIPADPDMKNNFSRGEAYKYSRADIGPEYYDFGTPGTRMVPVSTASRMSGNNHVIVFGTRDRARFDMAKIKEMTEATPAQAFSNEELFTTRPRSLALRYTFDQGPGEEFARLMKENLDLKEVYKTKPGMSFSKNGIDAYYVKTHPDIGDFGHYRGTFKNPEVLIIADPIGYDDLITARALTGERGQYLQGLMNDLGVSDKYLVLKTVPFGMDQATASDWQEVLKSTATYREALISAALKSGSPKLIIADGAAAISEVTRLVKGSPIPVVKINRTNGVKGIVEAGSEIAKLKIFKGNKISGSRANIPRSHLSFYARTWEGTSGDSVIAANDQFRGFAFAVVAPAWAWKQKSNLSFEGDGTEILIRKIRDNKLRMPGEKIPLYLRRVDIDPGLVWIKILELFKVA